MNKRFSFTFQSDLTIDDGDVDELMIGLYPSCDVLEQKCTDSMLNNTSQIIFEKSLDPKKQRHVYDCDDNAYDQVIEYLPIEFFSPHFDPIELQLSEISDARTKCNLVELFMNKIEETDTNKDIILGQLNTFLIERQDELNTCMSTVLDINKDLHAAGELLIKSRKKIATSREIIQIGAMHISNLQLKRDKLAVMVQTVRDLRAVKLIVEEKSRAAELAFMNDSDDDEDEEETENDVNGA
jgi:phospholipid N-methyltransferase